MRYRTAGPRLLAPLALALALLGGACAGRSAGRSGPLRGEALLRVDNQAWSDMNIYVLRGSQRVRLGTVSASSTRIFTIPKDVVGLGTPLRFLADPIGSSRTPTSDEITVYPGETVTLTIPNRAGP